MHRREKLVILVLSVMIAVSILIIFSNNQNPFVRKSRGIYRPGVDPDVDKAVNQAHKVYQQKKELGEDFTAGECLTNDLLPEWVADIAHSPRQNIDNEPQNQCQAYLEGRATHFVELDPEGNVLRVF